MKKYPSILILMMTLFITIAVHPRNLAIRHSGSLENYELLDVYIHGHYAFIPAGLGGLNIVDISNPGFPHVVSDYHATGCDWGRLYAWTVNGNYAYGTGRECGMRIIDISNINHPEFMGSYSDPNLDNERYEHPSSYGNLIFAARHQAGVEVLSVAESWLPTQIAIIPTHNAWATLAHEDYLYVADGSAGIRIYDITLPHEPHFIAQLPSSGSAKHLDIVGDRLFVAVGAGGVDMIDISDPTHAVFMSNYNTSGYASRVAANDSLVAVSDWDDVEVLGYQNGNMTLKGYKNTGGRVMALNMVGNTILSAEWERLTVLEYEHISAADLDISISKLEFPRVPEGESELRTLRVENNGGEVLDLAPSIDNSDFQVTLDEDVIAPGGETFVEILYTPGDGNWRAFLNLNSNDPDEPAPVVLVTGNYPHGPMVGDAAPGFSLPRVNGSGYLTLADLEGSPTVIAFFTAW